jgi:hypothetical protein
VLEGAGFHAGGVSSYQLYRRIYSTVPIIEWEREHIEELMAGRFVPWTARFGALIEPRDALALARDFLPLTVLPGYVASLAAAVAYRQTDLTRLEKAKLAKRRIENELGCLPLFAWWPLVLLFLGAPSIRNQLETSVFKLRDTTDVRQSCMSAAWDLGYMQLMSLAQGPDLRDETEGRLPVLVTGDERLGMLASRMTSKGTTGRFDIAPHDLDPRREKAARSLLGDVYVGTRPTWDACERAASVLEQELGLEHVPLLRLDIPPRLVVGEEADLRAFFDWLEAPEGDREAFVRAFSPPESDDGDAFFGGLIAIEGLIRDNADAHGRSKAESWKMLRERLETFLREREFVGMQAPYVAFGLCHAQSREDWNEFSAWVGKLRVEGGWGPVLASFWRIAREVLEDTAVARECDVADLLSRIRANLDESGERGQR